MGCFLACFGYTKKRKRLKPAYAALPRNKRLGNYVPLDSAALEAEDDPFDSREKPKQKSIASVRKKVSFNLNVQSYEPINVEEDSQSDAEIKEEGRAEAGVLKHGSISSQVGSYPQNYRYIHVLDGYDEEEDDMLFDDYDIDDDDDDEDYDDEDYEDEYDEDYDDYRNGHLNSETNKASSNEGETETNSQQSDSLDGKRPLECARDMSQYVHSVLNPVENLTQWKAAKAKALPPPRHTNKENVALPKEPFISFSPTVNPSRPLLQEVSVHSSLSNWLDLNAPSAVSSGNR